MPLFRKALATFAAMSSVALVSTTAQAADYQQYLNGSCAIDSVCNIDFSNVPAGKVLTLSNLSCYLRFPVALDIYAAQLLLIRNSTGAIVTAITPSLQFQNTVMSSSANAETVYVSNDTIRAVATQGHHFRAYAEVHDTTGAVRTVSQYACHISGTLTP